MAVRMLTAMTGQRLSPGAGSRKPNPFAPSLSKASPQRKGWATTALLAGVLLAYGNGSAWRYAHRLVAGQRTPHPEITALNRGHMALLALSLAWAALERIGPRELGLEGRALPRSLGWGLAASILGFFAIRGFFALPLIRGLGHAPEELARLSRQDLRQFLLGQMLFGSAILEEVAFRGLLHAKLTRLLGARRALLLGSAVFAAWHLGISWFNLRRAGLPRPLLLPSYLGTLGVLYAAGLIFGSLRQATGHLAAGILTHWAAVAAIVLALRSRGRTVASPPGRESAGPTARRGSGG